MANTFTLIEAKTLSSAVSTVTFSLIPQTYTDLRLVLSLRSSTKEGLDEYSNNRVRPNADANLSYNDYILGQYNSGVATGVYSAQNIGILFNYANGNLTTGNTFSNTEIYFPNYTSSIYKSFIIHNAMENNSTKGLINIAGGVWNNTAPITSLTITEGNSGSYVVDSSFYLYGIKKL